MPNDWIDEKPKDTGWIDKKPTEDPSLKTLKDIGDERQKASEAPKPPMPIEPPPVPVEDIPYARLASSFGSAAEAALASYSRLDDVKFNLNKVSIVVEATGPKGKELIERVKEFQSRIETISSDLKKISEELADYKKALPKDAVA